MYEAIERLRRLLMEHGIEYETAYISDDTYWNVNGIKWHAFESFENTIWIACNSDVAFTPEQVIAITLGEKRSCASCPEMDNPDSYIFHLMRALEHEKDTCKRQFVADWLWKCSKCGSRHDTEHLYNFCPSCGALIVGDEIVNDFMRANQATKVVDE